MRTVQESYSLAWTLNLVTPPRSRGSFFAAPGAGLRTTRARWSAGFTPRKRSPGAATNTQNAGTPVPWMVGARLRGRLDRLMGGDVADWHICMDRPCVASRTWRPGDSWSCSSVFGPLKGAIAPAITDIRAHPISFASRLLKAVCATRSRMRRSNRFFISSIHSQTSAGSVWTAAEQPPRSHERL